MTMNSPSPNHALRRAAMQRGNERACVSASAAIPIARFCIMRHGREAALRTATSIGISGVRHLVLAFALELVRAGRSSWRIILTGYRGICLLAERAHPAKDLTLTEII